MVIIPIGFDVKLTHTAGSKMILSDTLSRWPDHCPDEDHDNEDMTMLPDELFVNLLDTELQERIAERQRFWLWCHWCHQHTFENGPIIYTKMTLEDWKMEETDGRRIVFIKERTISESDTLHSPRCPYGLRPDSTSPAESTGVRSKSSGVRPDSVIFRSKSSQFQKITEWHVRPDSTGLWPTLTGKWPDYSRVLRIWWVLALLTNYCSSSWKNCNLMCFIMTDFCAFDL